jgi:pimeloyl-ACP methyl ester carboxylesterase
VNKIAEHTVTSGRLTVSGAHIYYEVRGAGPTVLLVGSPMDAASFAPLADRLADDHAVVTLDPRGINRSSLDDRDQDSTPQQRADDLARLLTHLELAPAAAFGSSGGAVTVLALAEARPELVHTAIAHEPPLHELLPDREERRAAADRIVTAYLQRGRAEAWRLFLADANIELPEPVFAEMFAQPLEPQAAADEDFFFRHEMRPSIEFRPDLGALRTGSTRIVVGIGEESAGQVCDRTSTALAAALGVEPVTFPGDHIGFVDDPDRFAQALRSVLRPAGVRGS